MKKHKKAPTYFYEKLQKGKSIDHAGMRYPAAITFEASPFMFARHPVDYERDNAGDVLYALPGGGRATESQIRGEA